VAAPPPASGERELRPLEYAHVRGPLLSGIGLCCRIRRVYTLPNPNELYLRIVEEMYEPEAVEARLRETI